MLRIFLNIKYSRVCYNARYYNKQMLQQTWRNTIGRHSTHVRCTAKKKNIYINLIVGCYRLWIFGMSEINKYKLFKMIVRVLTTCHTQYTWDRSIYIFYLIEQHSKFLLHTLQVLYMCTLCDSTNINIIEFVPHVSGDGFIGGSDSYLQFRDTCRKMNINLILDVTP